MDYVVKHFKLAFYSLPLEEICAVYFKNNIPSSRAVFDGTSRRHVVARAACSAIIAGGRCDTSFTPGFWIGWTCVK